MRMRSSGMARASQVPRVPKRTGLSNSVHVIHGNELCIQTIDPFRIIAIATHEYWELHHGVCNMSAYVSRGGKKHTCAHYLHARDLRLFRSLKWNKTPVLRLNQQADLLIYHAN